MVMENIGMYVEFGSQEKAKFNLSECFWVMGREIVFRFFCDIYEFYDKTGILVNDYAYRDDWIKWNSFFLEHWYLLVAIC